MRQDENYRCVAPGKTPKFRISINEKCPLQARPSTLTGITIITMWRLSQPGLILTTAG